jgi:hypothetical protein
MDTTIKLVTIKKRFFDFNTFFEKEFHIVFIEERFLKYIYKFLNSPHGFKKESISIQEFSFENISLINNFLKNRDYLFILSDISDITHFIKVKKLIETIPKSIITIGLYYTLRNNKNIEFFSHRLEWIDKHLNTYILLYESINKKFYSKLKQSYNLFRYFTRFIFNITEQSRSLQKSIFSDYLDIIKILAYQEKESIDKEAKFFYLKSFKSKEEAFEKFINYCKEHKITHNDISKVKVALIAHENFPSKHFNEITKLFQKKLPKETFLRSSLLVNNNYSNLEADLSIICWSKKKFQQNNIRTS